jgi:hypothetical protein
LPAQRQYIRITGMIFLREQARRFIDKKQVLIFINNRDIGIGLGLFHNSQLYLPARQLSLHKTNDFKGRIEAAVQGQNLFKGALQNPPI